MFHHKRSAKTEGYRIACVSIAFVIACIAGMQFLGNIKENEHLIIYGVLAAIFIGLWAFLVIPNLLNKDGYLEIKIDKETFFCQMPDGESTTIPIKDIKKIEKRLYSSQNQHMEYWIYTHEGEGFKVPSMFGLSPHKVQKTLQKMNDQIAITKQKNY